MIDFATVSKQLIKDRVYHKPDEIKSWLKEFEYLYRDKKGLRDDGSYIYTLIKQALLKKETLHWLMGDKTRLKFTITGMSAFNYFMKNDENMIRLCTNLKLIGERNNDVIVVDEKLLEGKIIVNKQITKVSTYYNKHLLEVAEVSGEYPGIDFTEFNARIKTHKNLYLTLNPIDMITCSGQYCNWNSCFGITGGSHSSVRYLIHNPYTIMLMIGSPKNKIGRQWIHIAPDGDAIMYGRNYGNIPLLYKNISRKFIRDKACEHFGYNNKWRLLKRKYPTNCKIDHAGVYWDAADMSVVNKNSDKKIIQMSMKDIAKGNPELHKHELPVLYCSVCNTDCTDLITHTIDEQIVCETCRKKTSIITRCDNCNCLTFVKGLEEIFYYQNRNGERKLLSAKYCKKCLDKAGATVCSDCGVKFFNHDMVYGLADKLICQECFNAAYKRCQYCGDPYLKEYKFIEVQEGKDTLLVCENCSKSYFNNCAECNRLISVDHTIIVHGFNGERVHVCEECYPEHYRECTECGDIYRVDVPGTGTICNECIKDQLNSEHTPEKIPKVAMDELYENPETISWTAPVTAGKSTDAIAYKDWATMINKDIVDIEEK